MQVVKLFLLNKTIYLMININKTEVGVQNKVYEIFQEIHCTDSVYYN